MILTIRTDKPDAEIGLYTTAEEKVDYYTWLAHRQLSETILASLTQLLDKNTVTIEKISGIIFYKGPGSFTGLRIGASVANAMASTLNIPCIAENGEDWIERGVKRIGLGKSEPALPFYGEEPRTTLQKK